MLLILENMVVIGFATWTAICNTFHLPMRLHRATAWS